MQPIGGIFFTQLLFQFFKLTYDGHLLYLLLFTHSLNSKNVTLDFFIYHLSIKPYTAVTDPRSRNPQPPALMLKNHVAPGRPPDPSVLTHRQPTNQQKKPIQPSHTPRRKPIFQRIFRLQNYPRYRGHISIPIYLRNHCPVAPHSRMTHDPHSRIHELCMK